MREKVISLPERKELKLSEQDKLKKFMEKFELQYVPEFAKFILSSFDNYLSFFKVVDKLDRTSDEFQNLSKYHIEALNYEDYNKNYQKAVKSVETDGYPS